MTTLQEAAQHRSLYELTGDIKDFNTMLVPRTALAQQGEQRCTYCDGTGDVHGIDGEWRGTCPCAAAPAPQAQPMTDLCQTCAHFQQGKLPGVRIHDETCYGCSEYYANKWEMK